jgi:hypothetical protein
MAGLEFTVDLFGNRCIAKGTKWRLPSPGRHTGGNAYQFPLLLHPDVLGERQLEERIHDPLVRLRRGVQPPDQIVKGLVTVTGCRRRAFGLG